jgi:hypothetical protein
MATYVLFMSGRTRALLIAGRAHHIKVVPRRFILFLKY